MQPYHLTDDEFIHELSLRSDPVSKRTVALLDKAQDKIAEMTDELEEADRILTLGEELNDWLCRLPEGAEDYLEGIVEAYEAARIWVCGECLMAIANDDYTGLDAHYVPDLAADREKSIRSGIAGLDNPAPGERTRDFSAARCDCCGTHQAGSRHEVFEAGKIR